MRVVLLRVGMPQTHTIGGMQVHTGGIKIAVDAAMLRFDGFERDGQADRKHHGGRDRTACLYPAEHYAWWKATHGADLAYGAFAENLTVEGARESEICIGDIFRVGDARVQVTLPRDPCRTLDRINERPGLAQIARESGRAGFHMRTLAEGLIRCGDDFLLETRHPAWITVASVLDLYHGRSRDRALFDRLCAMPEFAEEGKRELGHRLA